MEIYVGNPPVLQRIHVDTGSPLTTIKCSDCKVCIDKKVTNYNELTSFTSKKLTCVPIKLIRIVVYQFVMKVVKCLKMMDIAISLFHMETGLLLLETSSKIR